MNILVINAGSSSLKYQLFEMESHKVLAKGICERIGLTGHVRHSGKTTVERDADMPDHASAIRVVCDLLVDGETGVIADMKEINAVGHRVVHGGEAFNNSVLITDDVIKAIEDCVPLAPLHNPPNLVGIRACAAVMGDVPQVAVFDTAFHQSMPEEAYIYALPYEYYEKYKVRRYGFHGTSHRYVSQRAAELVGKPISELKIITCHLGNGSSIAAINGGKSVDTSMGLTPLEGVPMGTRSGSIDPAILEFVSEKENLSQAEMVNILNKKSGVLGISGVSSDFRDLLAADKQGNKRAGLALRHFIYKVRSYIGAYAAAMGGADVLVFTAGVGENNVGLREELSAGFEYMGFTLDKTKNDTKSAEAIISTEASPGKILVVSTNEELVIALDTEKLV